MLSLSLLIMSNYSQAAVIKTVYPDSPTYHYIFVDNTEEDNMFIAPTQVLNPKMTGANKWTSRTGPGAQTSLAYVDNGNNTAVTGWHLDMWEKGPIASPYVNQRLPMGLP